jgi:hypothetical protein
VSPAEKERLMVRGKELVRSIYERHLAGCCWHIVLDDGNTGDSAVAICVETAKSEGHADCIELAGIVPLMSKTQRRKVARVRS